LVEVQEDISMLNEMHYRIVLTMLMLTFVCAYEFFTTDLKMDILIETMELFSCKVIQ
jgi:hypothetical protein